MNGFDPAVIPHLLAVARVTTESIAFVFLDSAGATLGLHHIPSTRFSSVDVPLRMVVALALAHNSHAIVMAHNHPSGDPTPSEADLSMTKEIQKGCKYLGLTLHDHIIVGAGTELSLRALGKL